MAHHRAFLYPARVDEVVGNIPKSGVVGVSFHYFFSSTQRSPMLRQSEDVDDVCSCRDSCNEDSRLRSVKTQDQVP